MLTKIFPVPAVVAVTAGLIPPDFIVCTPPATNKPAPKDSIGLISLITLESAEVYLIKISFWVAILLSTLTLTKYMPLEKLLAFHSSV